jgi:hypothetical protein
VHVENCCSDQMLWDDVTEVSKSSMSKTTLSEDDTFLNDSDRLTSDGALTAFSSTTPMTHLFEVLIPTVADRLQSRRT